ncbi:MAG: CPBP family intramembrane glutamic endopeptidase [Jatrophihabitans sp.]
MSNYRAQLTGRVLCAAAGLWLARRHRVELLRRPRGRWCGALLALVVPATTALVSARGRRRLQWQRRDAAAEGVVAAWVISGALAEELLWRLPPLLSRHRAGYTAASALTFAALHIRRDGRDSAAGHLGLAMAWSVSAARDRSIFWPTVGHILYNYAALSITAPGTEQARASCG